jgi:hypothetical protein
MMRDVDEQFAEWSILPDHVRHVASRVLVTDDPAAGVAVR